MAMVAWVSAYMLLYMLSGITGAWLSSHIPSYVLSGVKEVPLDLDADIVLEERRRS